MAIIKTGAIVTDIRGKLGGHFFSKNKGASFMATKYKPKKNPSFAQSAQRSDFNTIAQLWRNLTGTQRTAWNLAAANFKYKDRFGDTKSNSGYWLFVKINLNLVLTEQGFVFDVPVFTAPNNWQQSLATYSYTSSVLSIGFDMHTANDMIAFYATPMLSAGIANPLNYFRHIGNWADSKFLVLDFTNEYSQHFTYPTLNSNFYIGVKMISSSGISTKFRYFNFFDVINA